MRGRARACYRVYHYLVLRNSLPTPPDLHTALAAHALPHPTPPPSLPFARTIFASSPGAFPPPTPSSYDLHTALNAHSIPPPTPPPPQPFPRTVFASTPGAFPPPIASGYALLHGKQQARSYYAQQAGGGPRGHGGEQMRNYQRQHWRSSAQQAGGGRPRTPMAVPFQVAPEAALALLREHLTGHLLAPTPADLDSSVSLSAVFQPFWTFAADVEVAYRANVGKASSAMAFNPYSRRWERSQHIMWQATPWFSRPQQARSTDPLMQLYAATSLPRSLAQVLAGDSIKQAVPLIDRMLTPGRQLELFTISRERAWAVVKQRWIKHLETELTNHLKWRFEAERVTDLEIHLTVHSVTAKPIFLPSYVASYYHDSWRHTAVISATSAPSAAPAVAADRLYSQPKSTLAAAAALTAGTALLDFVLLGAGGLPWLFHPASSAWWMTVGALSLAAGWLVRMSPRLALIQRGVQHAREVAEVATGGGLWGGGGGGEEEEEEEGEFGGAGWGERREGRAAGGEGPGNPFDRFAGFGDFRVFRRAFVSPEDVWREFERMARGGTSSWAGGGFGSRGPSSGYQRTQQQKEQQQQHHQQQHDRRQQQWQQQWEQQWQQQYGRKEQQQQEQWQKRSGGRTSSDPKGYYAALGLGSKGRQASQQEIKSAFRQLAMETHPDREPDERKRKVAEQRFKKIAEAYEVLRDAKKRAAYDSGGV
ncbi:hypothetical protein CLOM_g8328 [Closterium sp. NIES-68]|nr:hypothetical protein CLOM_g8328 [Closterium sp. NIES-68]GJP59260.1 hypothetical protein CLOP_g10073 [Closterium sp. NIES-67]